MFEKIKDVIAQTDLTDRAIRLYIENGLVFPENQRTYTGCNSYEFTGGDVDRLREIALLWKAPNGICRTSSRRPRNTITTFRMYLIPAVSSMLSGYSPKMSWRKLQRIRNYNPQGPTQQAQWGDWRRMRFTGDPCRYMGIAENCSCIVSGLCATIVLGKNNGGIL